MTKPVKRRAGEVAEAAIALEEELRRMDAVAKEALRLPLDTRRNIERTAAKLAELGTAEEQIGPLVQALLASIQRMTERQQARVQELQARGEELQRRRAEFERLMEGYSTLGKAAEKLNGMVQALAESRRVAGMDEVGSALQEAGVGSIAEGMTQLIESASALSAAALREGFEDLSREVDSLRQQLLAARNRINLLATPRASMH